MGPRAGGTARAPAVFGILDCGSRLIKPLPNCGAHTVHSKNGEGTPENVGDIVHVFVGRRVKQPVPTKRASTTDDEGNKSQQGGASQGTATAVRKFAGRDVRPPRRDSCVARGN